MATFNIGPERQGRNLNQRAQTTQQGEIRDIYYEHENSKQKKFQSEGQVEG